MTGIQERRQSCTFVGMVTLWAGDESGGMVGNHDLCAQLGLAGWASNMNRHRRVVVGRVHVDCLLDGRVAPCRGGGWCSRGARWRDRCGSQRVFSFLLVLEIVSPLRVFIQVAQHVLTITIVVDKRSHR